MKTTAVLALLTLSACATSPIGREPEMSSVGQPLRAAIPALHQNRSALSVAPARAPEPSYADASLWRSGPASLFGDRRARGLGDILTVVVEIDESAQMSNTTNRSRDASESGGLTSLFGLETSLDRLLPDGGVPSFNADSATTTGGTGNISRNEQLELRVAATVTQVLPNGHLVVQGNQEVRVNFELRDLQVAGIVRPEDISRRNEITYDKIAGARIVYGGRGQITDLQQPRYGQQIIERIAPF